MSADNGIYILETPKDAAPGEPIDSYGFEYRVRELMAVENLYFDESALAHYHSLSEKAKHSVRDFRPDDKEHVAFQEAHSAAFSSNNPDVQIANARVMWKGCTVFNSKEEALAEASRQEEAQYKHGFILEYGISFIRIDRVF